MSQALLAAVGSVGARVEELRASCANFSLGNNALRWPDLLDKFTMLAGHMQNLQEQLRVSPALRELVLYPVSVTAERSLEIEKATGGALDTFNAELIPEILRTKLSPELDAFVAEHFLQDVSVDSAEVNAHIDMFNEAVLRMNEVISDLRIDAASVVISGDSGVVSRSEKTPEERKAMTDRTKALSAILDHGEGLTRARNNTKTSISDVA